MVGPELALQNGRRVKGVKSSLVGARCDILSGINAHVRERRWGIISLERNQHLMRIGHTEGAYLAVVQNVGAIELMDIQLPGHVLDDAVDVSDELTFEAGYPA